MAGDRQCSGAPPIRPAEGASALNAPLTVHLMTGDGPSWLCRGWVALYMRHGEDMDRHLSAMWIAHRDTLTAEATEYQFAPAGPDGDSPSGPGFTARLAEFRRQHEY